MLNSCIPIVRLMGHLLELYWKQGLLSRVRIVVIVYTILINSHINSSSSPVYYLDLWMRNPYLDTRHSILKLTALLNFLTNSIKGRLLLPCRRKICDNHHGCSSREKHIGSCLGQGLNLTHLRLNPSTIYFSL